MPPKPILCISFVAAFLLGAGTVLGVTLSVPDISGAPGDTVSVSILVDNAAAIAGIEFILAYDAGVLTAMDAQLTPLTADFHIEYGSQPGKTAITMARSTGITSGGGALVNMTFQVNADVSPGTTSPLTLMNVSLYDEDTQPISATVQGGTFTVVAGPLSSLTITPSGTVTVEEEAFQFQAQGTDAHGNPVEAAVRWTVDPSGLGTVDAGGHFTPTEVGNGLVIAEADGIRDSVVVVVEAQPEQVYNYPNPARGSETTFRYYLNGPAQVSIEIYDLSRDFVQELSKEEAARGYGEIQWDLSGIASGVYVYRFRASYPQTEVLLPIKKVLVIR